MERPFAVVEFDEDGKKCVAVVSKSWLSDNQTTCFWPSGIGSHQKLTNHSVPNKKWLKYPCKVLKFSGNN